MKYIPSIIDQRESIFRDRTEIGKNNSDYSLSGLNWGLFVQSIWKSGTSMRLDSKNGFLQIPMVIKI